MTKRSTRSMLWDIQCADMTFSTKLNLAWLLLVLAMLVFGAAAIRSAYRVTTPMQKPCDCGTICQRGFHCGLKDCPHGRN